MYSLVLMSALAPGADVTPAPVAAPAVVAGCYGSCFGSCYGSCTGSCYGSCFGSCYGSCTGSCHGHGHGLFHRRGGGFLGHHKSCLGCSGYSCSGYNCFGSCVGTCIGTCTGCTGCYGGGVSVAPTVMAPAYGVTNYADPVAVYGRVTNINPAPAVAAKPMTPPSPLPEPKKLGANIKFQVPADAKLYVDGNLTVLTGTERAFSTPELVVGEKFYYDVKAELTVDGKPVVEQKRVVVEAGANITETFPTLFAAVRSKIEVAGK